MKTFSSVKWGAWISQGDNDGTVDNFVWSFKAGLLARALKTLRVAGFLDESQGNRALDLVRACHGYMKQCINPKYELEWEVKTSFLSGETNSETQSWTVLGMLPARCSTLPGYVKRKKLAHV